MLSPYGVSCAYVCMGTWSSLLRVSATHASLFGVKRLLSNNNSSYCLTFISTHYEQNYFGFNLYHVQWMCNY